MIRVNPASEPLTFDAEVRKRGMVFLNTIPPTSKVLWKGHEYWRSCLADLRRAYGGICAYSCMLVPADTGFASVEHFVPKDTQNGRPIAYEWSNYRFVCGRLNGRKKDFMDVLDPFKVDDTWFVLDFPSLLVRPSKGLQPTEEVAVRKTVDRLRLNDDETCVEGRRHWVSAYCQGMISFDFVKTNAPFVGRELERQGLVDLIKEMWNVAAPSWTGSVPKPAPP